MRLVWLLILLFVLFYNNVSSCLRNQFDRGPSAPLPSMHTPDLQLSGWQLPSVPVPEH
jgi:hypothetical protein